MVTELSHGHFNCHILPFQNADVIEMSLVPQVVALSDHCGFLGTTRDEVERHLFMSSTVSTTGGGTNQVKICLQCAHHFNILWHHKGTEMLVNVISNF